MPQTEKHPTPIDDDPVFRDFIESLELCRDCDPCFCPKYKECIAWFDRYLVGKPAYLLKTKTQQRYMNMINKFQAGSLYSFPVIIVCLWSERHVDIPFPSIVGFVLVPMAVIGTRWVVLKVIHALQ
jgi:hypothetical protein